ncbi:unnamed protein product [Cyprideis torosa]|uniref:Uncharacterized protein n=1 Tax=Cyprideis torosa TaxID=163714 RepID=A0A7R8WEA6_9CRUS|nr:unnamed protein product [Cyprideis torosa]CAG0889258.1 unnamed protein product [Cyprideis torosa]
MPAAMTSGNHNRRVPSMDQRVLYESLRRRKFNQALDGLALVLPERDPSRPLKKLEILRQATKALKSRSTVVKDLETQLSALERRNLQLIQLLREARIAIPPSPPPLYSFAAVPSSPVPSVATANRTLPKRNAPRRAPQTQTSTNQRSEATPTDAGLESSKNTSQRAPSPTDETRPVASSPTVPTRRPARRRYALLRSSQCPPTPHSPSRSLSPARRRSRRHSPSGRFSPERIPSPDNALDTSAPSEKQVQSPKSPPPSERSSATRRRSSPGKSLPEGDDQRDESVPPPPESPVFGHSPTPSPVPHSLTPTRPAESASSLSTSGANSSLEPASSAIICPQPGGQLQILSASAMPAWISTASTETAARALASYTLLDCSGQSRNMVILPAAPSAQQHSFFSVLGNNNSSTIHHRVGFPSPFPLPTPVPRTKRAYKRRAIPAKNSSEIGEKILFPRKIQEKRNFATQTSPSPRVKAAKENVEMDWEEANSGSPSTTNSEERSSSPDVIILSENVSPEERIFADSSVSEEISNISVLEVIAKSDAGSNKVKETEGDRSSCSCNLRKNSPIRPNDQEIPNTEGDKRTQELKEQREKVTNIAANNSSPDQKRNAEVSLSAKEEQESRSVQQKGNPSLAIAHPSTTSSQCAQSSAVESLSTTMADSVQDLHTTSTDVVSTSSVGQSCTTPLDSLQTPAVEQLPAIPADDTSQPIRTTANTVQTSSVLGQHSTIDRDSDRTPSAVSRATDFTGKQSGVVSSAIILQPIPPNASTPCAVSRIVKTDKVLPTPPNSNVRKRDTFPATSNQSELTVSSTAHKKAEPSKANSSNDWLASLPWYNNSAATAAPRRNPPMVSQQLLPTSSPFPSDYQQQRPPAPPPSTMAQYANNGGSHMSPASAPSYRAQQPSPNQRRPLGPATNRPHSYQAQNVEHAQFSNTVPAKIRSGYAPTTGVHLWQPSSSPSELASKPASMIVPPSSLYAPTCSVTAPPISFSSDVPASDSNCLLPHQNLPQANHKPSYTTATQSPAHQAITPATPSWHFPFQTTPPRKGNQDNVISNPATALGAATDPLFFRQSMPYHPSAAAYIPRPPLPLPGTSYSTTAQGKNDHDGKTMCKRRKEEAPSNKQRRKSSPSPSSGGGGAKQAPPPAPVKRKKDESTRPMGVQPQSNNEVCAKGQGENVSQENNNGSNPNQCESEGRGEIDAGNNSNNTGGDRQFLSVSQLVDKDGRQSGLSKYQQQSRNSVGSQLQRATPAPSSTYSTEALINNRSQQQQTVFNNKDKRNQENPPHQQQQSQHQATNQQQSNASFTSQQPMTSNDMSKQQSRGVFYGGGSGDNSSIQSASPMSYASHPSYISSCGNQAPKNSRQSQFFPQPPGGSLDQSFSLYHSSTSQTTSTPNTCWAPWTNFVPAQGTTAMTTYSFQDWDMPIGSSSCSSGGAGNSCGPQFDFSLPPSSGDTMSAFPPSSSSQGRSSYSPNASVTTNHETAPQSRHNNAATGPPTRQGKETLSSSSSSFLDGLAQMVPSTYSGSYPSAVSTSQGQYQSVPRGSGDPGNRNKQGPNPTHRAPSPPPSPFLMPNETLAGTGGGNSQGSVTSSLTNFNVSTLFPEMEGAQDKEKEKDQEEYREDELLPACAIPTPPRRINLPNTGHQYPWFEMMAAAPLFRQSIWLLYLNLNLAPPL